jgi:hypothetical protein
LSGHVKPETINIEVFLIIVELNDEFLRVTLILLCCIVTLGVYKQCDNFALICRIIIVKTWVESTLHLEKELNVLLITWNQTLEKVHVYQV